MVIYIYVYARIQSIGILNNSFETELQMQITQQV